MKKIIVILFMIILLPFLGMIIVNENSPAPVSSFLPDKCTRYCHDHVCKHKPEESIFNELYSGTIYSLKHNPFGLTYKEMNILVFVIFWPGLLLFLLGVMLVNHFYLLKINKKIIKSRLV